MGSIKELNRLINNQQKLIKKKNKVNKNFYNGVFNRYINPILTSDHVPVSWRYDLNYESNPYCIERLGINAVFNAGAIYFNENFYLVTLSKHNLHIIESTSVKCKFRCFNKYLYTVM